MSTCRILALASVLSLLTSATVSAESYTVKAGDTLHSISRRTGVSANSLMSINGISDPTKLRVGQSLKLSSGAPAKSTASAAKASSAPATSSGSSHTVQAGDTLYSIARKHGVSVKSLTAMNPGLNPSSLKIGQKISLVSSTKPKAVEKSEPAAKPKETPKPAKTLAVKETTPAPAPASKPVAKVAVTQSAAKSEPKPEPAATQTISTITLDKEISFAALASQHRTTPTALNALNGWDLKPTTVLARGSEIYIPKK